MLFRNLIFAPITEEIVFRAVIVATLFIDYKSKKILVSETYLALVSTIFFGVAHLHHLYEKIRSGEDFVRAITSTLVQFTYTSIFGFIAAILFIRTGSIFPPIISYFLQLLLILSVISLDYQILASFHHHDLMEVIIIHRYTPIDGYYSFYML